MILTDENKPRPHEGLAPAMSGTGPLLQRDYWAVICNARGSPAEVMTLVCSRFAEFAPEELVRFSAPENGGGSLKVGDVLDVDIKGSGLCQVRVIHRNAQSLTLATLPGHPEAGRITFGAYRNARGDVLFHIRSRARSGSTAMYMGFLSAGDPMQTNTWTDFVDHVAATAGDGVRGSIEVETQEIAEEPEEVALHQPTYWAQES